MPKTAPLVGIDIGSTSVRVAHVTGVDKDSLAIVSGAATHPLQSGAVSEGKIVDERQVGFAIAEAMSAAGAPRYGAVVGLSGTDVALTQLTVPQGLTPKEWRDSIRLAGTSISPRLAPEDTALSLQFLAETPGGKTLLAAAGATRDAVASVAAACRYARVTPKSIDISGIGTLRALTRAQADPTDVVTIVDIGATTTTVVTRQGLHARSLRVLDTGGDAVTLAIMGALGTSFTEAERRKHASVLTTTAAQRHTSNTAGYGDTSDDPLSLLLDDEDAVDLALRSSATTLIDQIAQAVESDADRYPDSPSNGLILVGRGALLTGLRDALSARVGVGAVLGRPWAQLVSGKGTRRLVNGTDPELALFSLTTAIGLGLWN